LLLGQERCGLGLARYATESLFAPSNHGEMV